MSPTPEAEAREKIDLLLEKAGWMVQDARAANIHAAQGVAIREFVLAPGHGHADYLLYIDGKAAGIIEAKRVRRPFPVWETIFESWLLRNNDRERPEARRPPPPSHPE